MLRAGWRLAAGLRRPSDVYASRSSPCYPILADQRTLPRRAELVAGIESHAVAGGKRIAGVSSPPINCLKRARFALLGIQAAMSQVLPEANRAAFSDQLLDQAVAKLRA